MTVFVLTSATDPQEGYTIEGIYSTEERARSARDRLPLYRSNVDIEEFEIDENVRQLRRWGGEG